MTLYILKYNNYYNRLVKKEETVSDYSPYVIYTLQNTNFNPNDGVNTEHVIGVGDYDGKGDYVIITEEKRVASGTPPISTWREVIVSRWFIVEAQRTRGGQWNIVLRRDVIADYKEIVTQCPVFIEKATLPESDNFIFNNEDMTFNQIKTSQTALFDETGCPWVVGYIPRDSFTSAKKVETQIKLSTDIANIVVDSLSNWEYNQYQTNNFGGVPLNLGYNVYIYDDPLWAIGMDTSSGYQSYNVRFNGTYKFTMDQFGYAGKPNWPNAVLLRVYPQYVNAGWSFDGISISGLASYNPNFNYPNEQTSASELNFLAYPNVAEINTYYNEYFLPTYRNVIGTINAAAARYINFSTAAQVEQFRKLSGQIIYESDTQTFYSIQVVSAENSVVNTRVPVDNGSTSLFTVLKNNLAPEGNSAAFVRGTAGQTSFSIQAEIPNYRIELKELEANALVTLDNNRLHLDDSPYDMFCMPYSDTFSYTAGGITFTASKSIAKNIATEIGADTGSGNIYDVQLLPYCPVRYCIRDDGSFNSLDTPVHLIYDSDLETKKALGAIIWANTSTFSFPIAKRFTATNLKLSSQTDLWRLCSPNGSGMFDFNVAKNGGSVDYFNVDCTYKPFNPYIHVSPDFKRLYGQDFDDYRGLSCGGDFSLAQVSNAWSNYELNNKNYQAMFDRNIQSMELNNSVQKKMDIANAAAGTVSGAASGATAGAAFGPVGAIVGGVIGAAGAGVTGGLDVKYNQILRNEAIDLTKDQFGYQLGNIQAIPTSITKTSALTANNPLVPYVEYYTCSTKEKQALENKLKYNGMTVMRIGTITEFLQEEPSYIKGKLIRIEYTDSEGNVQNSVDDDYHLVNAIAGELNQGVYI